MKHHRFFFSMIIAGALIAHPLPPAHAKAPKTIIIRYGTPSPLIVCAMFHICEIAFQPGESVLTVTLGDTVRWKTHLVHSGPPDKPDEQRAHLVVKPTDPKLYTSLLITTNRRVYHLRLRSDKKKFMPRVEFSYPARMVRRIKPRSHRLQSSRLRLSDLNFNYTVTGNAEWKPLRVYSTRRQTIIEFPELFSHVDAPALLVIEPGKGLFASDKKYLVNYRINKRRYIVDRLFTQALLIHGVGSTSQQITIKREEPK